MTTDNQMPDELWIESNCEEHTDAVIYGRSLEGTTSYTRTSIIEAEREAWAKREKELVGALENAVAVNQHFFEHNSDAKSPRQLSPTDYFASMFPVIEEARTALQNKGE